MTNITDYYFNNMSRIGNDNCDTTQRNIQNMNSSNLRLTNYYSDDCNMNNALAFALGAPNINYNGSHQVGIGGCNIDTNSDLLIDPITRPPCRISLFQRPFATVPYLGRGQVDPETELMLKQGDQESNRRTNTALSEKSSINRIYTPMIPSLVNSMNNPKKCIENSASKNWVRGGIPSRELIRDQK